MLLRWVVCIMVLLKVVVIVFCRLQVIVVVSVFQICCCLNSGMVISSSSDFSVSIMLQWWLSCRVLFCMIMLLSMVFRQNVMSRFYRCLIMCQLFCVRVMLSWLVVLVMWLIVWCLNLRKLIMLIMLVIQDSVIVLIYIYVGSWMFIGCGWC